MILPQDLKPGRVRETVLSMPSRHTDIVLTNTMLRTQTINALEKYHGVTTLPQLRKLSGEMIIRTPQISHKGLADIKALLDEHGMQLTGS